MAYTTRKSLLRKVRDGNEIGWNEFCEVYQPLILRRGMDFGLNREDLSDLIQNVMLEFFRKDLLNTKYDIDNTPEEWTFRYNTKQGRFRDFFRRVVTNHALKLLRERRQDKHLDDLSVIQDDMTDRLNDEWEQEWREHLLTQAKEELKGQVEAVTYQAFELYALKGKSVKETAAFLEISAASVYAAKTRCTEKLKKIMKDLEEKE